PSVVCIFDSHQRGGGSGVIIDPQGYGLTNYHVVAGMLDTRRGWGGLGDGKLYELEVLGIDPTGDVAMFRLTGAERFPYVGLGDSDAVRVGDAAVVMGNPFSLSDDYTPSVTVGLVTGVHRYQKGVKGNLTYTDCIQVDASVNPGNSGGPLFNAAGEVIGINGRISVNTRGRFNVGLGYAISSNQIQRFIPAMRAGLLARHGTLQATVDADPDGRIVFQRIAPESNADRAGIRRGDTLLTFDGVSITSGNHYASLLGTYPADWPVPIEIEQEGQRRTVVVRLDTVNPKLRKPFTPDREVNVREVERVLRAFSQAALGSVEARRPMGWKWTFVREFTPGGGGSAKASECYEASQTGDGPVRMQRRYDDGSPGPLIVYDDRTATQRIDETSEPWDLAPDVGMIVSSLYVMQRWMLEPVETIDLTKVTHGGGDRIVPSPHDRGGILEVLEWPVAQSAVAKFGFDAQSGRLLMLRVRDTQSGAEATIDLKEYRSVGGLWPTTSPKHSRVFGLTWPQRLEVHGPGLEYSDVLSNWELTP
ncbi:MAG: trypsin-like peptidase domain-containing protein, partial [Planctomycetota bacterium]